MGCEEDGTKESKEEKGSDAVLPCFVVGARTSISRAHDFIYLLTNNLWIVFEISLS